MTLENNEIDIHESVDKKAWVKKEIEKVYKKSNNDLKDLQFNVVSTMEKQIKMDHVKKVLQDSLGKFKLNGYKATTETMGAGLTMSIQIALKMLSKSDSTLDTGIIDGVYMTKSDRESKNINQYANSKTRSAVKAFQKANGLVEDGRAGPATIAKILEKLGDGSNEQPVEEQTITEQPVEEQTVTEQPVEEQTVTEQPVEESIITNYNYQPGTNETDLNTYLNYLDTDLSNRLKQFIKQFQDKNFTVDIGKFNLGLGIKLVGVIDEAEYENIKKSYKDDLYHTRNMADLKIIKETNQQTTSINIAILD